MTAPFEAVIAEYSRTRRTLSRRLERPRDGAFRSLETLLKSASMC